MIEKKGLGALFAILLAGAVVLTACFTWLPDSLDIAATHTQPEYATKLFNKDSIMEVDITADPEAFANMLENATDEEYIECDVTINGTTFQGVGLRPKGNSSLSQVASDPDSDRYSFKIEFDQFTNRQSCYGLDKLALNNIQGDTTYMKEYLSYDMLNDMGVTTPLYAFANITVNGEPWGFYLAVECIEEAFAYRNYGNDYGNLYKPESMGMRGGGNMQARLDVANGQNEQAAPVVPDENKAAGNNQPSQGQNQFAIGRSGGENRPPQGQGQAVIGQSNNGNQGNMAFPGGGMDGGFGGGNSGTSLVYTDDNIESYSGIFDNTVLEHTTESDYKTLVDILRQLNAGENLESCIDVEEVLQYFAVNTVIVNLDSYVSNMKHNYYLYEKGGKLSILPWDYNLAFAGFQSGDASAAVNFPIDTPVSGATLENTPLLGKLLEVEEYKALYHSYLQKLLDGYLRSDIFDAKVDALDALIQDNVKNDPSAFFTYEQYTNALTALKTFATLRAQSIAGQLNGSIPATTEGQSANPAALIDTSSLNLNDLGSMGGGMRIGIRDGENGERNVVFGAGGANMPDQETMAKAIAIIRETNGELTEAQKEELKSLGLDDEIIGMLSQMPMGGQGRQGGPGGQIGPGGNAGMQMGPGGPGETQTANGETVINGTTYKPVTKEQLLTVGTIAIPLLIGLILVLLYRKRKYHS